MATADRSHLDALNLRLSHERARLAAAKTDAERTMRAVWVAQIEREVQHETAFLQRQSPAGQSASRYFDAIDAADDISDDDLLAALTGGE